MAKVLNIIRMARCEGQDALDSFRVISQYALDGLHDESDGFVPVQKPNPLLYANWWQGRELLADAFPVALDR
jgi:hypothetical protein